MQIIKDQNNVVIFAGGPFDLTETGMIGPGFSAPTIKSTIHTLETVDSIPSDWAGGDYAYDGEWTLTAQGTAKKATEIAQAQNALKTACEKAIVDHIQAQVDIYNQANGLVFSDVKSCALYGQIAGYSHQPFCQAVWLWSVNVWETARAALTQALSGEIVITSPDDVIALLPLFEFTGE